MRITAKGQVTIPAAIREKAGLLPHTEVDFVIRGGAVVLVAAKGAQKKPTRGHLLTRRLRGSATVRMSTDEILSLTRGDDD